MENLIKENIIKSKGISFLVNAKDGINKFSELNQLQNKLNILNIRAQDRLNHINMFEDVLDKFLGIYNIEKIQKNIDILSNEIINAYMILKQKEFLEVEFLEGIGSRIHALAIELETLKALDIV